MKQPKRISLAYIVIVLIMLFININIQADNGSNNPNNSSNYIIVKLASGVNISNITSKFQLAVLSTIANNSFLLSAPNNSDTASLITSISKESGVIVAEANSPITTPLLSLRQPVNFPGGDPTFAFTGVSYQYQPITSLLQLDTVHTLSRGQGIKVAVIDTGVDFQHPDLVGHISPDGYDFVDNDNIPNDEPGGPSYGHGTFIAGLIALISPDSQILPLRVIKPNGYGDAFEVAAAIRYAVDHGAKVINLSLGSDEQPQVIKDQLDYAQSKKCIVIAAAGNTNSTIEKVFPACSGNAFAVSAIDSNYLKANFSNYGGSVYFSAFGVNLTSTFPNNKYVQWSGTSFAAPLVTAEAALVLAVKYPGIDLMSAMKYGVIKIDALQPAYEGKLGCGAINPLSALKYATKQNK